MNRLKYIYWITPLLVLLSCGRMLTDILGGGFLLWLIVAPALLITWGVVWMRLYGMPRMRPEFAILSILPQSIYFICRSSGSEALHQPIWQNFYTLLWIGFAIVMILSMKPGHPTDPQLPASKDRIFVFMAILAALYAFTTMGAYAAQICNISTTSL